MNKKKTKIKYSPTTGMMYGARGPALAVDSDGYRRITYNGKGYLVHRLAWEMMYGPIPKGKQIDHINRNKKDNRIANLRAVSQAENKANTPKPASNTSGWKGVSWDINIKRWRVRIDYQEKKRLIAVTTDLYEAVAAYNIYALSLNDPCIFINKLPRIGTDEYIQLIDRGREHALKRSSN